MIATQHTLVARLQAGGSEEDWSRFYDIYERPILAFAAAHSLAESECADVLQETMIKMLRTGFSRFDPAKGRFTGFLFNIARCYVVDAIRRRARREARHTPLHIFSNLHAQQLDTPLLDATADPAGCAERAGEIALVIETLDALLARGLFRPKTVNLFKAVALDQQDPKRVAEKFGTSVGNVYEAKRAVLNRLGRVLRALDQGADLEEAFAA